MKRLRARSLSARENGNSVLVTLLLTTAALFAVFLVVDGRQVINAQERAHHLAGEAARIGADQIDAGTVTGQGAAVDPSRAYRAAQTYLAAEGATGTLTVAGNRVTVTTTISAPTTLYPGPVTVQGTASASPEQRVGG
ncbi:hypothetical protein ABH924_003321 [Arthrobacter sp. GAS37]|uniref:pilus assembly protein TadG-related protein n=1 Tax=Arthrobacter sp. GAS37 TaxID=3156261 RepID=UPI003835456B